eukprot:TRINITY_DN29684_c0_g1_i1.p1 TRINITY_DN29684_c0_g1~~TRINITY_DN29684_c0_g1_i1.p1  ORF type:complete len:395 (+),score=53.41 TRINITY_DN29684_c0_g1_i1:41-1225(+)
MATYCHMVPASETFQGNFVLKDVEVLQATDTYIRSPALFSFGGHEFGLKVGCKLHNGEPHLSIFWRFVDIGEADRVIIKQDLKLLRRDGTVFEESGKPELTKFGIEGVTNIGYDDFCSWASLEKAGLCTGDLTIKWKATVSTGRYLSKTGPIIFQSAPCPEEGLSADWGHLLESGICSDVTVKFNGGKRNAHKTVLLARSEVFRRMFMSEMKEARDSSIDILDADASAVDDFLLFLYTGRIIAQDRSMYDICLQLLPLAKKYEVESLVQFCSEKLARQISENNAADILSLADVLSVMPLRRFAIQFITRNSDTARMVQDTDGWDKLSRSLLREILFAVVSQGSSTKRGREEKFEFVDGSDWERLGISQLRRACSERNLASDGTKESLVNRLSAE